MLCYHWGCDNLTITLKKANMNVEFHQVLNTTIRIRLSTHAIDRDQLVLLPSFIINKVCELVAKILYCAHKVVSYNLIWN